MDCKLVCEQFGESFIRDIEKEATSVEDFFNQKAEKVPAGSEGLITIDTIGLH